MRLNYIQLAVLMACASCKLSSVPVASELKIVGGQNASEGQWESAVALVKDGQGFCTGTLVHPRLVISAAHCFFDEQKKNIAGQAASMSIVIGTKETAVKQYKVERVNLSPRYQDGENVDQAKAALNDVAYLKLASEVTGVEIIPMLLTQAEIDVLLAPGYATTLVGFGQDENKQYGTKKLVETTVQPPKASALVVGAGGKDSCYGDSGGPAYGKLPNGQWRVYGITSRGVGDGDCGTGGLYARMHDEICWIMQDSGVAIADAQARCAGQSGPGVPGSGAGAGAGAGAPGGAPGSACWDIKVQAQCNAAPSCAWSVQYNDCGPLNGGGAGGLGGAGGSAGGGGGLGNAGGNDACWDIKTQAQCSASTGCSWSAPYQDCAPVGAGNPSSGSGGAGGGAGGFGNSSLCWDVPSQAQCSAAKGCAWSAQYGDCGPAI